MKRVLLFLGCLLTVLSGFKASAAPNDLPQVSTAADPLWYVISSYSRGGELTIEDGAIKHINKTDNSFWRFEKADDNNGYYVINENGQYLNAVGPAASDQPVITYILPNGVNALGICLSSANPTSAGWCVDANNYNDGCGNWRPYSNDWQGTTWIIHEWVDLVVPEASTATAPKWYSIASYNRGGYLTAGSNGQLSHVALSPDGLWRLESTGNTNGYYVINTSGMYLGVGGATTTPTEVFVLPNGVNDNGLSISRVNPISGSSCIDANNYNELCGTWRPSASDWQGTTWVFAEQNFGDVAVDMTQVPALFDCAAFATEANAYAADKSGANFAALFAKRGAIQNAWMAADGKVIYIKGEGRTAAGVNMYVDPENGGKLRAGVVDGDPYALWTVHPTENLYLTFENEFTNTWLPSKYSGLSTQFTTATKPGNFDLMTTGVENRILLHPVSAPAGQSYHWAGGLFIVGWYNGSYNQQNLWTIAPVTPEEINTLCNDLVTDSKTDIANMKNLPILFDETKVNAIETALNAIKPDYKSGAWAPLYRETAAAVENAISANGFESVPFFMQGQSQNYPGVENKAYTRTNVISAYTVWKLEQVPGTLTFKIYNPAGEVYVGNLPTTTDTAISPVVLASAGAFNVKNAGTDIAMFYQGNMFFNDYNQIQSSTGTGAYSKWTITEVSLDQIKESAEDAMNAAKPAADNAADKLANMYGFFNTEDIDALKAAINSLNPEITNVEEALAAAGNVALREMFNEMIDRPFYIRNWRRGTSNRATYMTVRVPQAGSNINSVFVPSQASEWKLAYVGDDKFTLRNPVYNESGELVSELYITSSFTTTDNSINAATYNLENVDGYAAFKFPGSGNGLNMDGSVGQLTSWTYNDGGSKWIIADPAQAEIVADEAYAIGTFGSNIALTTANAAPMSGDKAAAANIQTIAASGNGSIDATPAANGNGLWILAGNNGSYTLQNYMTDLYLGTDLTLTTAPATWQLKPASNGTGMLICTADNTMLSQNNGVLSLTADESVAAIWTVAQLPATIKNQFSTAKADLEDTATELMPKIVSGFYGMPLFWDAAELDNVMNVLNSETASYTDKQTAFASVVANADNKPFTIYNARRYCTLNNIGDRASGNLNDAGIAGNVPYKGAQLYLKDNDESANTKLAAGINGAWVLKYNGNGSYLLTNLSSDVYAKNNFHFSTIDDAAPLYIRNCTEFADGMGVDINLFTLSTTYEGDGRDAMHINSAAQDLTFWTPSALSSYWIAAPATLTETNDGYYTAAPYSRDGLLGQTNAWNMSSNPASWAPMHMSLNGLAFWQLQDMGHGTYALYNTGAKTYLNYDIKENVDADGAITYTYLLKLSTDGASAWHLVPGPDGAGNYISTSDKNLDLCIIANSGTGLSLGNGEGNENALWFFSDHQYNAIVDNVVAELTTDAVKTNATTTYNRYAGYESAFTWGKGVFTAEAEFAKLFTSFSLSNSMTNTLYGDNIQQAVLDYNYLSQATFNDFGEAFSDDIRDVQVNIINVRRSNATVTDALDNVHPRTDYMMATDEDGNIITVDKDMSLDPSALWTLEPSPKTPGCFRLRNGNGLYIQAFAGSGTAAKMTDKEARYTDFVAKAVLNQNADNGTALVMNGKEVGLNCNTGSGSIVSYSYSDAGSTWKIEVAAPAVSGIENVVDADNAEVDIYADDAEVYTLQGARISRSNIASGIYVVRQGGKVAKVAVK